MRAVFTHIAGLKAGQRVIIEDETISIGRAPTSALTFAPADTRASAHHAEIEIDAGNYVLRDAGSTNGTFLNGRRISTARLKPGDVIEFGTGGPQVQFDIDGPIDSTLAGSVAPTQMLEQPSKSRPDGVRTGKEFGRTTVRLMIDRAVDKSSTRFRVMVATLSILVIALMGAVGYLVFRPGTPAGYDFSEIARKHQSAVVFIYVRFTLMDENGTPIEENAATGSGFVVNTRGDIITNRHVLQLWEYEPNWVRNHYKGALKEIKVVFADHSPDDALAGQVVKISDSTDVDLAVLRIQPYGGMPVISSFNRDINSLSQGDPVAVIGYPLGKDLFDITKAKTAETSLSQGVISKVSALKIQIDASANPGNSGGPIFDQRGRVIAVMTQGLASLNAQNINFGTPIGDALDMLPPG